MTATDILRVKAAVPAELAHGNAHHALEIALSAALEAAQGALPDTGGRAALRTVRRGFAGRYGRAGRVGGGVERGRSVRRQLRGGGCRHHRTAAAGGGQSDSDPTTGGPSHAD
jgi:hypothetical protein